MKKAQTELIGLAVIILMITLGMLFYLRLSKPSDGLDVKQSITSRKIASSILSVMLRTTREDIQMRSLFQACAEQIPVGGQDPCIMANETATDIFDATLKQWGKDYNLTTSVEGHFTDIYITHNSCPAEKSMEIFIIPTDRGPMTVKLEIC